MAFSESDLAVEADGQKLREASERAQKRIQDLTKAIHHERN